VRYALLLLLAASLACVRPNPYYVAGGDDGDTGPDPAGEGEGEGPAEDAGHPDPDASHGEVPARFGVEVPGTVREDEPFELTISAEKGDGAPITDFGTTLSLVADRGDLEPSTLRVDGFPGGKLTVTARLNREGVVRVSVTALGGRVQGGSDPVQVRHGRWLRWAADDPVLDRGNDGEWDGRDVAQPSVLRIPEDAPTYAGKMLLYYRGRDAALVQTGVGVALSDDGQSWRRAELNPVMPSEELGPRQFIDFSEPHVVYDEGRFRMWVTGTTQSETYIAHAESADGLTWERNEPNPVIRATTQGSWDELWVFAPSVLHTDVGYEAWYGAFAHDGSFGIGRAVAPDGVSFDKPEPDPDTGDGGNPVLEPGPEAWDSITVDKPAVLKDGGVYRMWYTGDAVFNDSTEHEWAIGYATSPDGVVWEKSAESPVFEPSRVEGTFDSVRVANPSVVLVPIEAGGQELWMYYDGFDGARWAIGLARRE